MSIISSPLAFWAYRSLELILIAFITSARCTGY